MTCVRKRYGKYSDYTNRDPLWRWFWRRWFMYKLHRLHEEPRWLAAWRACKKRAKLGTPAYWHKWRRKFRVR
jgi:hypothetical protein